MEEKKEEEKKEEGEEQTPSSTISMLERYEKTAKRMEEATERYNSLVKEQAEIATRIMLGGNSEAGRPNPQPKKETEEEKWAREAEERYAGTGLSPVEDKTPTTYG